MFQKKILISMLIILFGFSLSCNNDEDETKKKITNSAAKITIADFQNIQTTDIPMTEMYNTKINEIDEFYNNKPSGTQDSTDICMDNLVMEHNIRFEKDTDDTYKVIMNDIDFKKCIPGEPGIILNSAIGSLVMERVKFIDVNGNPVNPEGESLLEMEDVDISQSLIKSYISKTGSNSSGTVTFTSTMKVLESSEADSSEPCLWTKNTFENDCTFYQLDKLEISDPQYQGDVELIKLTARKGLGKSGTGVYFTNGTIDVIYNNWSGSMTYDSDPSTPPTYILKDGGNTLSDMFKGASIKSQIFSNISKSLRLIKKQY